MPFGCRRDFEFSRMRVESMQDAATTTTRARTRSLLFGVAVEILHAVGAAFVVDEHARHHGVVDHLEASGAERGLDQVIRRIEERADVAAFAARAAIVAGGVAVVRPREDGAASGDDADADIARRFLQQAFAAAGRGRRKVVAAAGQRILIVIAAAHADQLIHLVVVGRDVFVADGPRESPSHRAPRW